MIYNDLLGSTKTVVSASGNREDFDYKPFGEPLNSTNPRIGFTGKEKNIESRYINMGARQYDPALGRFMSPDPLFELSPGMTPYHYCHNSPLIFKDPSGLTEMMEEIQIIILDEIDGLKIKNNCGCKHGRACPLEPGDDDLPEEPGGGGGSGGGGNNGSYSNSNNINYSLDMGGEPTNKGNYSPTLGGMGGSGGGFDSQQPKPAKANPIYVGMYELTAEKISKIKSNISINCQLGIQNGDELINNFWNDFLEGHKTVTECQFDYISNSDIRVHFFSEGAFESYSIIHGKPNAIGWTNTENGIIDIFFSEKDFRDNSSFKEYSYSSDPWLSNKRSYTDQPTDRIEIIMHEFGHGFAYNKVGENYNIWHKNYKENWAIDYVNQNYRVKVGCPIQVFHKTWYLPLGYMFTFGFTCKGYNP